MLPTLAGWPIDELFRNAERLLVNTCNIPEFEESTSVELKFDFWLVERKEGGRERTLVL